MAARRLRSRAAPATPAAPPDVPEATGSHEDLQLSDLPFFTDYPLCRASHLRRDITERAHCDAAARVLLLHDGCVLCSAPAHEQERPSESAASDSSAGASAPQGQLLICRGGEDVEALRDEVQPAVFLGTAHASAAERWFALDVSDRGRCEAQCGQLAVNDKDALRALGSSGSTDKGGHLVWINVRNTPQTLPLPQGALAATASGMLAWHRKNAFSGASGVALTATQGGWALRGAEGERCAILIRLAERALHI